MLGKWVIVIQFRGYLTNRALKNGIIHDENFNDVIVYENQTKEEVEKYGEKLFGGMRASWHVVSYDEAKKEYEDRVYRNFNNNKYKIGQYLELKEALKLLKEGYFVLCKKGDNTELLMDKLPDSIEIDIILNARFYLLSIME